MKVLVINGPNLNMLGIREPDVYGRESYADLKKYIRNAASVLGINVTLFQSNHEGEIVDIIQSAYGVYDGIVINPAAYTHTSIAILDALKTVSIPTVEVHISDISKREDFRQFSYISLVAKKTICGHGFEGYRMALEFLKDPEGAEACDLKPLNTESNEDYIICKCNNVSYFDILDEIQKHNSIDNLLEVFEKVKNTTHCSTGCGGCYDKVIAVISATITGGQK